MADAHGGFQLGLLPERKINKRALAVIYGLVALFLLIINVGLLMPEHLQFRQYHLTELIPRPSLRPEPPPVEAQVPKIKPKLLTEAKAPVLEEPKLVVPPSMHREAPKPVEAPKIVVNRFDAPQLKMNTSVRPQLVHSGDFGGSTPAPTVNASVQKVQTGGFGSQQVARQGPKIGQTTDEQVSIIGSNNLEKDLCVLQNGFSPRLC